MRGNRTVGAKLKACPMSVWPISAWPISVGLISILLAALAGSASLAGEFSVTPANMARVGTIDERYQSYNIEMVEVTGGEFWKPYGPERSVEAAHPPNTPGAKNSNKNSNLFQYRPPIDLTNARLRKLASALAPAYLRVSGTWANTTYFADSDDAPSLPPAGFKGVLTRLQWRQVIDFAHAVDARIVTSFAVGAGNRDAAGLWTPEQARHFIDFTRAAGGSIAAAEFINEPNLAAIGGLPAGYDPVAYGRDFKLFRAFVKQTVPQMMILGPGTINETPEAADLLAASGPGVDAFSYHHYGALSQRCAGTATPEAALSEAWLSRTDQTLAFYRTLRDRFEPGKPIWLTETAETACGGNPWAATFLDTFRYLDQLGRLAKAGVQVVMHNTLAASDYGLLDERTLAPRPNYWGALLWRQLMGTTVLDPGVSVQAGLHVYAHCQRGTPGGVTLLVINTDRNASHSLKIANVSERFTLDAANLQDSTLRLNGNALTLGPGDRVPRIAGVAASAGILTIAPTTITFLAVPAAANIACG
jgi:Glycosyl hydrolase family 79, N-terminal domain